MRGVIKELYLYETDKNPYGFIVGDDGNKYYFNQQSIRSDVSKAEFDAWIQYVNQTLDISQKYTNWNIFTQEKIQINQASLNEGIPYIQRIQIIQKMLLNLSQQINNY